MGLNLLDLLQTRCEAGSLKLDVGANVGGYTFSMLDHPGDIHAFEPLADLARGCWQRFADQPRVTVWQAGVSDHEYTEGGFQVFEAWTLDKAGRTSRGLNAEAVAKYGADARHTVQFVTVDAHLHRYRDGRRISFLKVDTDGYELRVLKGANETLIEDRPPLLFEFNYMVTDLGDDPEELLGLLTALNYVVLSDDGVVRSPDGWKPIWPAHTTFDVGLIPVERLKEFGY